MAKNKAQNKKPAAKKPAEKKVESGETSLDVTEARSSAVAKTKNRVTLSSIKEKISHTEFINPEGAPHFTIAVVYLKNGFIVIGESAPADPENFNEQLGKEYAYENAVRKIWPMEGYLLCEKLA